MTVFMAQIVKAGRSENSITHTVRKSFFHTAMRRALASTQLIFSSGTWSCFLIDNALVVQVWTHCHLVLEHTEKCTPLFVIKGNLQYFLFFIKKRREDLGNVKVYIHIFLNSVLDMTPRPFQPRDWSWSKYEGEERCIRGFDGEQGKWPLGRPRR